MYYIFYILYTLIIQILSEIFLIVRRTERDCMLFLLDFNVQLVYLKRRSKNSQVSIFVEVRPVEPELFLADGWTDMTKLIASLRNSANAHKDVSLDI
jgi:hypothetical protein